MSSTRTYIFAGGGTGGHLFPGVAVARELQRTDPAARLIFVGSDKDLERSLVSRLQFEHRSLPVESLSAVTRRPIRFVLGNWRAWRVARRWIQELQPAVVIGLGGYASAPIVWAAARARIPVVLLEQNVIPGRTTRWLARSARLVCVSFAETTDALPRGTRVAVTGNPLRAEIADLHSTQRADSAPQELLVLGGSQGADSLNDAVARAAELLRDELSEWHIVHQSGTRQVASLRANYDRLSLKARVEPFFDNMAERYRSASLVISRAGATTLAELTCCGLPMILLPYPHAADNHQRANAMSLKEHGAAVVVEHRSNVEATAHELAAQLRLLLGDADRRRAMSDAGCRLAAPDAASIVARHIESLVSD